MSIHTQLPFQIEPQPDEETCGPSSLFSVLRYHEEDTTFSEIRSETKMLPGGGTLAVHLARVAMLRDYQTTIYTCDLNLFDPSWFDPADATCSPTLVRERMLAQLAAKPTDDKFALTTQAYIDYVERGGCLKMEDITPQLIAAPIADGCPVIAGLSATWLYRCKRERPADCHPDDIAGWPTGHFLVVHGHDPDDNTFQIADPYHNDPYPGGHYYSVDADRLIASILLSIVTYDAKLLVIRPRS